LYYPVCLKIFIKKQWVNCYEKLTPSPPQNKGGRVLGHKFYSCRQAGTEKQKKCSKLIKE
jgi:hypothetical protein